ncbi:hypothetical protein PpBr36_08356 [Pyricularia pennisetigena]|uniref:hypothetical protein n=1 Tax=Pyricularia pennisetigena TaxID=1578925 RepID=UPI001154E69B|nr:hypothetical protein PpBr36_08356 [Pyricularia pennisetigena]TLS24100.1 hypothetical protein PpBr36_08356 [Pyricularia pennisetigena]
MPLIRPGGGALGWAATAAARSRHGHLGRFQRSYSARASEPLRILFCGSDAFSCESLRALDHVRRSEPRLVKSIDVVTRPPKRTGRGLKVIRHAPIETLATDLQLPVHPLDNFRGWELPLVEGEAINLIIAVSFGLFIPSRILKAVKYGGLNLHPSFLPDLRGSAPIQWAIMLDRRHTGVTLQTLDDKAFDRGLILAQTPRPGIPIAPDATTADLTAQLAAPSATMLVAGLRAGLHVPPLSPLSGDAHASRPDFHARKLTKQDAELRWDELLARRWSCDDVGRRHRALGPLWGRTASLVPPSAASSGLPQQQQQQQQQHKKKRNVPTEPQRVILEGISPLPDGHFSEADEARICEAVQRVVSGEPSVSDEKQPPCRQLPLSLLAVEWEMEPRQERGDTARRYKTYWIPENPDKSNGRAVCVLVGLQKDDASGPLVDYAPCRLGVESMKMEGQPSRPALELVRYLGSRGPLPLATAPTN